MDERKMESLAQSLCKTLVDTGEWTIITDRIKRKNVPVYVLKPVRKRKTEFLLIYAEATPNIFDSYTCYFCVGQNGVQIKFTDYSASVERKRGFLCMTLRLKHEVLGTYKWTFVYKEKLNGDTNGEPH